MKKFILIIITIVFFICPSVCFSSYLIELKNGSTFITNHYWEQKGQIKFYFRGGVVGISRNLIRKIEKTDKVYIDNDFDRGIPKKEVSKNLDAIPKQTHLESEIRRLKETSKNAWERYNEVREGTKAERDEARKKAFGIDQKLKELTRESSVQ